MRYFLFLFFLLAASIGLSNDYSFTITGELPVAKLSLPSDIFTFEGDVDYQTQKRRINLNVSPQITTLALNVPSKEKEIIYHHSKKINLIEIIDDPPEKLKEVKSFFDLENFKLVHKPLKLAPVDQKTGGISVDLVKRNEMEIPDITYNSKSRTYQIPPPPISDPVTLGEERVFLQEGIGYDPLKVSSDYQSRIYIGTVDLEQYRIGFSNSFLDALVSNDKNRLFFKNDSLFIGAEASLDEMTAIAYFPNFEFKAELFDETFVLRTVSSVESIKSFDFGIALMNTTPLPIINWYTKGMTDLFSIGVDVFSKSSYGVGIRLKNDPFVIRGGTGYDFSNRAFHALIDGRYNFNQGLVNAAISYNKGISLGLGAEYKLISNNPFSLNICGNIDYNKDWLFSAGTKIRIGDFDLAARVKFVTGGLSVDVEAGYSF